MDPLEALQQLESDPLLFEHGQERSRGQPVIQTVFAELAEEDARLVRENDASEWQSIWITSQLVFQFVQPVFVLPNGQPQIRDHEYFGHGQCRSLASDADTSDFEKSGGSQ